MRAEQRHVAPAEAGLQHQRVVAVVLGDAAHHHQEAVSSGLLVASRSTAPPSARSSAMSWSQTSGLPLAAGRDLVGALVDHLEAHVLQHRHALGQRDRAPVAPHLQADARLAVAGARVEIDAERALRRQPLDHADVGDGVLPANRPSR